MCGVKLEDINQSLAKELSEVVNDKALSGESKEVEELDLTQLDKEALSEPGPDKSEQNIGDTPQSTQPPASEQEPKPGSTQEPKNDSTSKNENIIDIKDILESEEKVEMDSSIKREALADDEIFSKICPMCGEDMQLNKQLLASTPVLVKCLKCGNETKIW
jgi:predicted RNA-binding Zn-ribbon protein involved in translation (DUF1610 family)